MPRRIFIAINISERIKEELDSLKKQWPALPCKWVKREGLHLTLAFLGYLNDKQLETLLEQTKEIGKLHQSFSIFFTQVCYGPDRKLPPRLIWIKGESSEPLAKLKEDIDKIIKEKLNIYPEEREFSPHITLGRIRAWDWRRFEPEERPLVNMGVNFEIPVKSFEIMESHLKRDGAEYTVLDAVLLDKNDN